jgi:hypothetical protein
VGFRTSVRCEAGVCREEIYAGGLGTPFAVAALAPGDYWMLARRGGSGKVLVRYKE